MNTPDFTVLVTGGRNYRNYPYLQRQLDRLASLRPITLIVHGGATGADSLAGEYARRRSLPCNRYLPDRAKDGPGPDWKFNRNLRMLKHSDPHLVVAFPGGPGTSHMVRNARARGYPVWDLRKDDNPPVPEQALPEAENTPAQSAS